MSEENYWSELNCLYDNLWSLQWLKSSRGVEKTLWPNCQRLEFKLISPNFMFPRNKSLMLSTVVKLAVGFTPLQKQLLFDLWGKVDGCAVPSSQSLRLLPEWWYFSDTLTSAGKCKLAASHPPGTTGTTRILESAGTRALSATRWRSSMSGAVLSGCLGVIGSRGWKVIGDYSDYLKHKIP